LENVMHKGTVWSQKLSCKKSWKKPKWGVS